MKVRKVLFKDFRNFRGVKEISFVDPVTDEPRPLTVLVGSNGTGKTTILEAIEGVLLTLFSFSHPVIQEAFEGGCICISLQISPNDLGGAAPQKPTLDIAAGRKEDILTLPEANNLDLAWHFNELREVRQFGAGYQAFDMLRQVAWAMQHNRIEAFGGVIYFPHYRNLLPRPSGGAIQPPPQQKQWIYRFTPSNSWEGSLEQFLVWQNYLDLEAGSTDREHLTPFLALIQDVLGAERTVKIKEGRVWVRPHWAVTEKVDAWVRIDQLPSGEQQVFYLFGELARQLRKGAVVMIDEPEISLHPTLQRVVVHKLRRLAHEYDLQVILATHSPEIVRSVSEHEVINLDYLMAEPTPMAVEGAAME